MKNPPNYRNGYYDDGSPVVVKCCPNCGSKNFVESISREKCDDCGLECNYWSNGPNAIYEAMLDRLNEPQKEEDERIRLEQEERYGWITNDA